MKQLDSKARHSLKARDVYQKTFLATMVVGCVLAIFGPITIEIVLEWVGVVNNFGSLSGGAGIGIIVFIAVAQKRAQSALRRAGLIREESEIIERTATTFEGESLEVRGSSAWGRLFLVVFLLLLGAVAWWQWQSQPADWFYSVGAIAAACWSVLILFNIRRPELRLSDEGIASFQDCIKLKLVRWEEIASLNRKRVWGLPPNYSLNKEATQTIFLQDKAGRMILSLHAGPISVEMPASKQRFIAEIERRLTGADLDD